MELAGQLMIGAVLGAAMGYVLGQAKSCSGGACRPGGGKLRLAFYMVAGAVFGSGCAWYFMGPAPG